LPSAAAANGPIFYANGRPRTVEEVYQVLRGKIDPVANFYRPMAQQESPCARAAAALAARTAPPPSAT
jgi:hypothetical protein